MSENTTPTTPQNEEVDLGQLFKMIGNAFQKLFDFIASIFKGVFHLLMLFLAHFYRRIKWYAIAGFLGLALGYFLEKTSDKSYGANMFIETNFNSAYQVYENINNLHELASEDKDSVKLAEILGISVADAASLEGFYIKPSIDENGRVKKFSEYKQSLDSISQLEASYEDFVGGLDAYNFKTHKIGVATTDKFIYEKLNKSLAKVLSDNEYLNNLLEVEKSNYNSEEETLISQEKKIDDLVEKYLAIREKESNKEYTTTSGTNILLGADAQKNELLIDEAELIKEKLALAKQRREVAFKKVKNNDIVSVISYFPSTGYDITKWYEKPTFLIPALFILLTLSLFVFIGLGKFVNQYQEQNKL